MAEIKIGFKTLAAQVVASAGTPQPISAVPLLVRQAIIQYDPANAGDVYIGESDVAAAKCLVLNASNPGIALSAEDSMADEDNIYFDLNTIYIDAATTGDKVNVAYIDLVNKAY